MTTEQPKEALTQIETENKPSLFTIEDFASTFPKRMQERYAKYQEALKLYRERGMTKSAIVRELNIPHRTVSLWVSTPQFPHIERRIKELKDLGLYPLTSNNQHLPFIALMAGWNTGDGHLTKDLMDIRFYERKREGLEKLRASLQTHFPKVSLENVRRESGENAFNLEVDNSTLAHLFAALGVPVGNKVEVPFSVPNFVLNGSRDVKRYYLAGLLGSEASAPIFMGGKHFSSCYFLMSKREPLESEHIQFLNQVRELLHEFGITTSNVKKYMSRKYGFRINGNINNLMKLYDNIPFEFFYDKSQATKKITETFNYHRKRAELYHKVFALKAEGKTAKEISRELKVSPRTIYEWIEGRRKPILANNTELTQESLR